MYERSIEGKYPYRLNETFMGFHCGNTPMCRLTKGDNEVSADHEARRWSRTGEPDITRGTLEGDIIPGEITFYRLQGEQGQPASGVRRAGRGSAGGHRSPSAASACSPSRR